MKYQLLLIFILFLYGCSSQDKHKPEVVNKPIISPTVVIEDPEFHSVKTTTKEVDIYKHHTVIKTTTIEDFPIEDDSVVPNIPNNNDMSHSPEQNIDGSTKDNPHTSL